MDENITNGLNRYACILEEHFHDMMDVQFTVENGRLYILSAHIGRRTALANLKIVIGMFCEGKMSVEDVITKLPYKQIEELMNIEKLVNADELELIGQGVPASGGVRAATVCFSINEAKSSISKNEKFILCQIELSPETVDIITSQYCQAVITARGGMTSHAAVICRGMHMPCVSGFGDFYEMKEQIHKFSNRVTVDGNNGKIYAGLGTFEKISNSIEELQIINELLSLIIKYNIITVETIPLIWRLWDVIVLHKHFRGKDNTKQMVVKKDLGYRSFKQSSKVEIENINSQLQHIRNGNMIVEDLIGFLFSELSAQVPVGSHYLYMRPLLNPMESLKYNKGGVKTGYREIAGVQLTGVEFFRINKYVDFLLDIYSIKIFFSTEFYKAKIENGKISEYKPLNYLDYTNSSGEGLIINSYNAIKVAIYVNDVLIPKDKLMHIYHLIRRRKYYWAWYKDNNISKRKMIDYLKSNAFYEDNNSKIYHLCEEMHLVNKNEITASGISLIEEESMDKNRNIDYILDEVIARGCNDNSSDFNDFSVLIHKKDFKDLIALELYEYYFWNERHEFDLELLKEIVERVASYFSNPETIRQIGSGLLQTLPSAIVISLTANIAGRIKNIGNKNYISEEESSWERLEKNFKKIDTEFLNHDYILSDDIEQIFGSSREEIQPLLKLCGCKCFIHKQRSIWIKAGTSEERMKIILKANHFKHR